MKLRRINIKFAPGIPDGFTIEDIQDGMNIISGPNGSGKTTLCNAIRFLLWPDGKSEFALNASWEYGGGKLIGDLKQAEKPEWQLDGISMHPDLPEAHLARCFTIRIDEILAASQDDPDKSLTSLLVKEMAGGYDLHSKTLEERFKPPSSSGLEKGITAAERREGEERKLLLGIGRQEENLPELKQRLENYNAKVRAENLHKSAKNLKETEQKCQDLEFELSGYPAGMDLIHEEDMKVFQGKREELQKLKGKLQNYRRDHDRALDEIKSLNMPNNKLIPQSILNTLDDRVQNLHDMETLIESFKSDIEKASATRKGALDALAPHLQGPLESWSGLQEEHLKKAELYYLKRLQLLSAKEGADSSLDLLTAEKSDIPLNQLELGLNALHQWLTEPEAALVNDTHGFRKPAPILFLLIIAACFAGYIHARSEVIPFAVIGVFGIIGLFLALRKPPETHNSADKKNDRYKDYVNLKLPFQSPDMWNFETVNELSKTILSQIVKKRYQEEIEHKREPIQNRLNKCENEMRELEIELSEFQKQTGLDIGSPDLSRIILLEHALKYHEAERFLHEAEASLQEKNREYAGVLDYAASELSPYPTIKPFDSSSLKGIVQVLKQRNDAMREAQQNEKIAKDGIDEASVSIEECEKSIEIFLYDRRLEDEFGLMERVPKLADYSELIQQRQLYEREIERHNRELNSYPDIYDLTLEEIDFKLNEIKTIQSDINELNAQIADINAKIEQAKRSSNYSDAIAQTEKLRADFLEKREAMLFAAAGKFLLKRLEDSQERNMPPAFQRASELFANFTTGAYHLKLDTGETGRTGYRAVETDTGIGKSLQELSSGTRVQLLMASRLAFVEQIEGDQPLPIFLDEILKHSDPQRYHATVGSLVQILSTGRQLFYLTNQSADVQMLTAALDEHGCSNRHLIDLGKIRQRNVDWLGERPFEMPVQEELPFPDGCSPFEYARMLHIPSINGIQHPGGLSLFYASPTNSDILRNLYAGGVRNIGQFQELNRSSQYRFNLTDGQMEELRNGILIAEEFLNAWNIGKGKPLTEHAVREGVSSAAFAEKLWLIAEECGLDSVRFLSIIQSKSDARLSGLREATVSKLESYLKEYGYLSEESPLKVEQILMNVLNTGDITIPASQINERVNLLWTLSKNIDS